MDDRPQPPDQDEGRDPDADPAAHDTGNGKDRPERAPAGNRAAHASRATPTLARPAGGARKRGGAKPVPVAQRPPRGQEPPPDETRRPRRLATSSAAKEAVSHHGPDPGEAEAAQSRGARPRRSALPERTDETHGPQRPKRRYRQPTHREPPQHSAAAPSDAFAASADAGPATQPARKAPADPQPASTDPRADAPLPAHARRPGPKVVDAPDSDAIVEGGPLVAPDTVAGRSLTMVVAIMTFLCAVLLGSALVIERAATAWSAQVLDDISVTVLPLEGDPVAQRTEAVAEILSGLAGVEEVAILSTAQSEALLEPWLGVGADLSLLPIPRMVTAQRGAGFNPDAASAALSAVPGASLDDHSGWSERLSAMAATVTGAAMAGLALMLVATAISIVFATRATIATNRDTVEVLHVLGADERFIQRAFRGRFMRIGVRGAALGLGAAAVLFGAMEAWSMLSVGAASQQSAALLGAPSIGLLGFLGLLALALSMALLVALTTRFAVRHHLKDLSQ